MLNIQFYLQLEASMLIQDERSQYVRTLNDGNNIPAIALGTFTKVSDSNVIII